MTKYSGAALYLEFGGVNISATRRTLDVTHNMETADSTAGSDQYRNFVTTVKMLEAEAEILGLTFDTGGSAQVAALQPGTNGTLIWGPEGTAAGKPKWGAYMMLSEFSPSYPFDDVVMYKAKFVMAGTALAFNGYTDKF
jgi:hypothetical protein